MSSPEPKLLHIEEDIAEEPIGVAAQSHATEATPERTISSLSEPLVKKSAIEKSSTYDELADSLADLEAVINDGVVQESKDENLMEVTSEEKVPA